MRRELYRGVTILGQLLRSGDAKQCRSNDVYRNSLPDISIKMK
jgi:hypothetical protein